MRGGKKQKKQRTGQGQGAASSQGPLIWKRAGIWNTGNMAESNQVRGHVWSQRNRGHNQICKAGICSILLFFKSMLPQWSDGYKISEMFEKKTEPKGDSYKGKWQRLHWIILICRLKLSLENQNPKAYVLKWSLHPNPIIEYYFRKVRWQI